MSSTSQFDPQTAVKFSLENDKRDIKDLWNDALKEYKGILGKALRPTFENTDDMFQTAVNQQDAFNKWRHDGKNLDKVRHLFFDNIAIIESGAQKLIAAASTSFPPAAAIGTALSFVLAACKGQSADYDIVTTFFEDMNNFLKRVKILEGRLPEHRAYQACLMDVFTSFLSMCAFATKFISKGRFKTFIIQSFMGQDADLSSARARMNKNIAVLQSATEFAILRNTESLNMGLQELHLMQKEITQNLDEHSKLTQEHARLMTTLQQGQSAVEDGVNTLKTDVQAILTMLKPGTNASTASVDQQSGGYNRIRSIITVNTDNDDRLRQLYETKVTGTGEWLFHTSFWKSWFDTQNVDLLVLRGPQGLGKSYLAAGVYDHLSKAAELDPDHFSIVTYFFCNNEVEQLGTFTSIISSIVLQISEQNLILRDRFGQKFTLYQQANIWNRIMDSDEFLEQLVVPSFGKDSKYQLYIVIDSVNELISQADHDEFASLIQNIKDLSLRIKIMATIRYPSTESLEFYSPLNFNNSTRVSIVDIGKGDVVPDIKSITANRMQVNDETYSGLTHLRAKTRKKIAEHIESRANTLLYVDFAFRLLNGIGREGAILRELERGLPTETSVLFERILKSCKRRLPQDLINPVIELLIWLTYSFDSLDLDQANWLTQFSSQDEAMRVEEEIEHVFSQILRIGPTAKTIDGTTKVNIGVEDFISAEDVYDDGNLLVALRDQYTKDFLCNIDITSWARQGTGSDNRNDGNELIDIRSNSHRTIFLRCCQILEHQPTDQKSATSQNGLSKLKKYAARHCLRHWQSIDSDKHNKGENVEVCIAFYNLLANRHGFAAMIEADDLYLDDILKAETDMTEEESHEAFSEAWCHLADWTDESVKFSDLQRTESTEVKLSKVLTYWNGEYDNAFQPLLEAHLGNWLNSPSEKTSVSNALNKAFDVLILTPHHDLSKVQPPDEYWKSWITPYDKDDDLDSSAASQKEIYLLRSLYPSPLTGSAHLATAMSLNDGSAKKSAAHYELTLAAKHTNDITQEVAIYMELSRTCKDLGLDDLHFGTKEERDALRAKNYEQALKHLNSALALIPDNLSSMKHCALLQKLDLLQERNESISKGGIDEEVVKTFHEIRAYSPTSIVDGRNMLTEELTYYCEDHNRIIDFFVGLTPIQRLSLVIDLGFNANRHILPAAVGTERINEVQECYFEILRNVNLGDCGVLWYFSLVPYLSRAARDMQMASNMLRQAFTYTFKSSRFSIANHSFQAETIVEFCISLATDVFYKQFRASNRPDAKSILVQTVEELPLQPLCQSVQMGVTSMLPHLVVLGRMHHKAGHFQKYQETLQRAFDICWANLHDDFATNDIISVRYLARILATGPSLARETDIANCAQLYYLPKWSDGALSDEIKEVLKTATYNLLSNDEPSLYVPPYPRCAQPDIEHHCPAPSIWKTWDKPLYTCLCCGNSFLCQDCYDERIRRNKSGEEKGKIDFCCDGGEYLKAPMEGWKGIKDGVIYIDNEEPLEFNTFLDQLRDKWKQAWDDFWIG